MIKKNKNKIDKKIWFFIKKEEIRQKNNINLIASENYVSKNIMKAQGSLLTNKYAEGYPNKRYYGGCKYVDKIEKIAIKRLKKIFKSESANVQPHSGSQANQSVLFAMLNPGDTIMGMSLSEGGHLTHGMKLNISGKWFNIISYGLNNKENIDYNYINNLAIKYKPKLIIAGASSFSLKINFKLFYKIAKNINSYFMVDMAHYSGLIAAKLYPNPVPYADFVTSTTHKTLRGPRGGFILMKKKYEKNINSAVFPGIQGGPLMHVIAAKAIAFKEVLSKKFKIYQKQVIKNAKYLSKYLINKKFKIISKKTESHLMLIDLRSKNINGKNAEKILSLSNIICNKNVIPKDPEKPFITSGIRLGTSAITTRGFKKKEMNLIGKYITNIIENPNNLNIIKDIKKLIKNMLKSFPIY